MYVSLTHLSSTSVAPRLLRQTSCDTVAARSPICRVSQHSAGQECLLAKFPDKVPGFPRTAYCQHEYNQCRRGDRRSRPASGCCIVWPEWGWP